ncbi:MAG: O-antigen ligase family protein, partial [Mycobacterium leprae]
VLWGWFGGAGVGGPAFVLFYSESMLAAARAAHSHNVYLELFAEMGSLGLIAVLWSVLAVIRRPFVRGLNARSSLIMAAVPAALVGLLFHGLVEHIWYNPKLLFAFWAVAGIGIGLALENHRGDGNIAHEGSTRLQ